MISALLVILIALGLAYLVSELLKKLGLPRAVGQIVAGLILSISVIKSYLFTAENLNVISFLANLGIVMMFYYIGLEINFKSVTKNIKRSLLISAFNTSIPLITGFFVMKYLFGLNNLVSLLIGIAMSVSAQAVSVDILEELKILKTKLGSLIITAGAVDDIMELLLVTIILSVLHVAISHVSVLGLMLYIMAFIAIVIIARIWVVPRALKLFNKEKSSTARFTGSLIILLLIATLADFLQIGSFIGALVAGVIVRQTIFKETSIPNWQEHDIANSLHIIAFGFLIPIFFVWIGLRTDPALILPNYLLILVMFVISTLGTVFGSMLAVMADKGTFREGLIVGWGLNPKADVELVIASLALGASIISNSIFTALVFMSLITAIVSPIVFKRIVKKRVNKRKKRR
ncbi:cation:proton antiporter [Candidatus Woesearchaeota archaeon]|nr:cation:proton antiporter [Candidatus Woesearchaeota archaeon]MBW3021555.1 cation:proton antiporter [Candidatus Woesearchaeota archaeon]